jgi:hypothetical protein
MNTAEETPRTDAPVAKDRIPEGRMLCILEALGAPLSRMFRSKEDADNRWELARSFRRGFHEGDAPTDSDESHLSDLTDVFDDTGDSSRQSA